MINRSMYHNFNFIAIQFTIKKKIEIFFFFVEELSERKKIIMLNIFDGKIKIIYDSNPILLFYYFHEINLKSLPLKIH